MGTPQSTRRETAMARRYTPESELQRELLRLLRPRAPRLARQASERVRPGLAEVGRAYAGRPAAEVLPALEDVVLSAGAEPDRAALTEFAEAIERGENPFA
jgi:hypothetical protein